MWVTEGVILSQTGGELPPQREPRASRLLVEDRGRHRSRGTRRCCCCRAFQRAWRPLRFGCRAVSMKLRKENDTVRRNMYPNGGWFWDPLEESRSNPQTCCSGEGKKEQRMKCWAWIVRIKWSFSLTDGHHFS